MSYFYILPCAVFFVTSLYIGGRTRWPLSWDADNNCWRDGLGLMCTGATAGNAAGRTGDAVRVSWGVGLETQRHCWRRPADVSACCQVLGLPVTVSQHCLTNYLFYTWLPDQSYNRFSTCSSCFSFPNTFNAVTSFVYHQLWIIEYATSQWRTGFTDGACTPPLTVKVAVDTRWFRQLVWRRQAL